ncbi:hypothetical protein NDU88_009252 [Pleurodeles waltl]|uniref:Uncharacterized protein n=1 Tax=Pleurodeles waltl TaxID=8319 RepID=A0AAV7P056_PLEWA|nr:hypothetical protein NDU88_009252 [Pleurodeles waltl]
MDGGKQCSLIPAGDGCGTADHSRTGHGRRKAMQPHACWCRMWHRRPQPHWVWTEESNAASCLLVTDVALQTTAALGMVGGKQCSLMPAGDGCGTADHGCTGHGRGKQCRLMPAGDGCGTADHGRTGHGQRKTMQPQALLVMDVTLQTTAALGMDRGKQCRLMPAGDGCDIADHSRTGHGRRKAMQPHACW